MYKSKYNGVIEVYNRGHKYSGRYNKKVRITNNMGALLHYVLTSFRFEEGHMIFDPAPDTQKLLDTFTYYDIVDTYNRLGLNLGLYGPDLSKASNDYVNKKVIRVYRKEYAIQVLEGNDIKKEL